MGIANEEKTYPYYMVNGGVNQVRTNIDMNINTRIQKKSSKLLLKNVTSERDCINQDWRELVIEINNILRKDDLELIHFNVDK